MGEFASKLLDRIKLPFVVIILAIDLACAGIIFLPEQLREMLYLESFRRNFIQWIGPSFFILTLLLIMYVLLSVFKFVGNFLEVKKFEHAIDHTLENLSDAEMEAILKIYFSPNQVAMFDFNDPIINSLISRRMVFSGGQQLVSYDYRTNTIPFSCTLQPFIRKRIDEEIEKEENWKADIQRKLSNPNLKECKRKELQKELEKHEETMQIVSNYKKHYR